MQVQGTSCARTQVTAVRDEVLRFGFTVDDVDRCVRAALRWDVRSRGLDAGDRYEAAWFGVVETLYSTAEPVEFGDLLTAGIRGLSGLRGADLHTRGFDSRKGTAAGPASAQGFCRYWIGAAAPATEAGFATRIVDELAVGQIFSCLTHNHREVLLALALHQDYQDAAKALGMSRAGFWSRVNRARDVFLGLWHEHETPGWRPTDRRIDRYGLPNRVAAVLSDEDIPEVLLPDALAVFDRLQVDLLATVDLLAELVATRPEVYTGWNPTDLAGAFRSCGVPPPRQNRATGVSSYQRGNLVPDRTLPVDDRPDEIDMILRIWLDQEQHARAAAQAAAGQMSRAGFLARIAQAGPDGVTRAVLLAELPAEKRGTAQGWLAEESLPGGALTRIGRGRYAAAEHAPQAEHTPKPADLLDLLTQAGDEGLRTGEIVARLSGVTATTIHNWLGAAMSEGAVTRPGRGRYAAA